MKKQFFHVLALVLALTMCFAMALPVLAAGDDASGLEYTPNTSGEVFFDKDLIMPKDATVPDVEFTFTLAANVNTPDLEGAVYKGWEIHKGIFNLKSTVTEEQKAEKNTPVEGVGKYSVAFTAVHATTAGGVTGNAILSDSSKKYATESFSIDFSKIDYKEPGIYRYKVTEVLGNAAGITYTDATVTDGKQKTFYVDVYVANDENGNPTIADVIVSENDELDGQTPDENGEVDPDPTDPNPAPGGKTNAGGEGNEENGEGETPTDPVPPVDPDPDEPNKTEPADPEKPNAGLSKADFINEYTPLSLEVDKTVSGSQASRTDDFTFTLEIDLSGVANLKTEGAYAIVYNVSTKSTDYIVARKTGDGKLIGTATVTLKHNESFKILLPHGATYTITEAKAAGYSTAIADSADTAKEIAGWSQYGWDVAMGKEDAAAPTAPDPEDFGGEEAAQEDEEYQKALKEYQDKLKEYTSATTNASAVVKEGENTKSGTLSTANATVSYVNFKDGITPTGILLAIAPFVVLMVVAVVGGVIVLKKKKED